MSAREAAPATAARNVAKTLAQTVVFWAVFLFVVPLLIVRLEGRFVGGLSFASPAGRIAGSVGFVLAGALGLWSGATMAVVGRGTPLPSDCARTLVIAGPYRWVRNPMAIAGLAQGACVGVYLGSPLTLGYVLAGALIWDHFVRRWEEADLAARFGEPYRRYQHAVRCWIPRARPYRPQAERR
jgi:protein-S-isoprenylcysteine O-methyltransferase Ste14